MTTNYEPSEAEIEAAYLAYRDAMYRGKPMIAIRAALIAAHKAREGELMQVTPYRVIKNTLCSLGIGYLAISFARWDILWLSGIPEYSLAERSLLLWVIFLAVVAGVVIDYIWKDL